MGGTSHPGSFLEQEYNPGEPNIEDEFKTSEHNSFHEEPVDVHNADNDLMKNTLIKGTPSTLDPLKIVNQEDQNVVSAELRRDPQEEFFKLAILSLKMIHTEKEEAEYIYEINSETLFQQVKQLHIPFHRWYQWLETKFAHMK